MTLTENAARIRDALNSIREAIISKGSTPSGNCETYADAILGIPAGGGTDVSDTTLTEELALSPYKFHKADGSLVEGTMNDRSHYFTPSVYVYENAVSYIYPELSGYFTERSRITLDSIPKPEFWVSFDEEGPIMNVAPKTDGFVKRLRGIDIDLRDYASELGVDPEKIIEGESILDVEGTAKGGTPCNVSNLILADYKKPAKNASSTFTWSGKARTIVVRYTLSNFSEAASSIFVINVNDDASYDVCALSGSSTTPLTSISSITNVNQDETGGSITLKNPSGAYTCYFSVMVFGEGGSAQFLNDDPVETERVK